MYPDDTQTIAFEGASRPGRRRLMILIAVLVAGTLLLVGALNACARNPGDLNEIVSGDLAASPEVLPAVVPDLEPIVLEEQPEPQPEPTGFPMGGGNQTGTMPGGPCPGVIGDGLITKPQLVRLLGGQTKGAVDIRNCGPSKVTWTASVDKGWVQLAKTQDDLASAATYRLLFTVHTASLPIGAYTFKIKISWAGKDTYVDVEGTKLGGLVAPGTTPSPAPTIGGLVDVASGCAVKCITKAWVTPIKGLANVSLEVKTNTSAKMLVLLDTSPPVFGSGKPEFVSPDVAMSKKDWSKQWNVVLKPLKWDTKYHVIVAATDMKGGTAYLTGTFRTAKPDDRGLASEPGGCSQNCVASAQLTRKHGSSDFGIEVKTHVPATMRLYANGVDVASTNNQFLTEWTSTLTLQPGQNYEIKLVVTDRQGHSQEHKALVSTPKPAQTLSKPVRITFHDIYVTDDGDDSIWDRRGELAFFFKVNGERLPQLDVGERKIRSPEWVGLGDGRSVVVENPPSVLKFRVQGKDRDSGDRPGSCTDGNKMIDATSGYTIIDGCHELEWNTAEGAIDLENLNQAGALPGCYGFKVQADICYSVAAAARAKPQFIVYVSVEFLD